MYVIGTAGHVDHGKSTLVRALTGIDPDRLREEKERGLTIDLGFAWLTLPGGEEVSIVDVPGHERFIKNMLAGVGGIDLALLVIAADAGGMPQTREQLSIDRAFTMSGFGTVVTGTLIDGSLRVGQEVEFVPSRLRSRIRGLQAHGRKVETATPGRRTAVNLTGVAVDDLQRGMVMTGPGWLKPSEALDVRLQAVGYLGRPIKHNLSVTFHTGSAEVDGRLLLLDRRGGRTGCRAAALHGRRRYRHPARPRTSLAGR